MSSTYNTTNNPGSTIWRGSYVPKVTGKVEWLDHASPDLRNAVEKDGRPVVLIGRNSASAGRKGCIAAATDAHEAAAVMAELVGLDARLILPSIDELAEALFTSPNVEVNKEIVRAKADGESDGDTNEEVTERLWKTRFCLVDLSDLGIIISLCAGSAVKMTEDHEQPHARWVFRLAHEITPSICGVFMKRFDRLSRTEFGHTRLYDELKSIRKRTGFMCAGDGIGREWEFDSLATSVVHVMLGSAASIEADVLRKKRVTGQRRRTGSEMVDGKVDYARSTAPPGCMTYFDRGRNRHVLAIDTPSNYPPESEADNLPQVFDAAGIRVDQVALIMWAISCWGVNGRGLQYIFDQLCVGRLSSQHLRNLYGRDAYFGGPMHRNGGSMTNVAQKWVRTMKDNLEFFKTGRLIRRDGDGGFLIIENVFPPCGYWGTPEDFARIDDYLADRTERRGRRAKWSWTGMDVVLDGVPTKLHCHGLQCGVVRWQFGPGANPDRRWHPLTDEALMTSIARGLNAANGAPLRPYLVAETDGSSIRAARDRAQAETELSSLLVKQAQFEAMLGDGETGEIAEAGSSALANAFKKEKERLKRIALLERQIEVLGRRAGGHRDGAGLPAGMLADLVEGLRNPSANEFRSVLRLMVRDLVFTSSTTRQGMWLGNHLRWTGKLVFQTETGPAWVPIEGEATRGSLAAKEARTLLALNRMRHGVVSRNVTRGETALTIGLVARLLGLEPRAFRVGNCADSELLKFSMAVCFPDPAPGENPAEVPTLDDLLDDEDLRASFGNLEALAARVRHVHDTNNVARWLANFPARLEVRAILDARAALQVDANGTVTGAVPRGSWTTTSIQNMLAKPRLHGREHRWSVPRGEGPTFKPCSFCGSYDSAPMLFREVTGYLCLSCRRDDAGVTWPARFDRFVAEPDLWLAAGVSLALEEGSAEPKYIKGTYVPLRSGRLRRWDHLSATDRAGIVDDYRNNEPIESILTRFEISEKTLCRVLMDEGCELRPGDLVTHE